MNYRTQNKTAIVIGAGIAGLAITRALAEKGYSVSVFERNSKAVGASIRNFGMIWPIGQPNGNLYERAKRSKAIWKNICTEAGLWYDEVGSLHLAYNDIEFQVLNEIFDQNKNVRPVDIINKPGIIKKSPVINTLNLKGALWSADEMIVESRVAIEKIPQYFIEKYNVQFYFNTTITEINYPVVKSGNKTWKADQIFICNGADFETLYPEIFSANYFTKCKLQMVRYSSNLAKTRIGPALCGGLSLIHYKSFQIAPTLSELRDYYQNTIPEYLRWGIHVMVSQNAEGELTIGDSHEYGNTFDPFDKQFINDLIINYLRKFVFIDENVQIQSWHGIYPKLTNGQTEFIHSPENGVTIVNGIGGAGMTLSFGLAEEVIQ